MPGHIKSVRGLSSREWLVEVVPVIWVIVALWIKQIYFGLSLQNIWLQESIGQWVLAHLEMFSSTLAISLVLLALTPLLPRVWRFILLLSTNIFVTTVILSDEVSIRFYGDVISVHNFSTPRMVKSVASSVLERLQIIDILYYVDIVGGVIVLPLYLRLCKSTPSLGRKQLRRLCTMMLLAGGLLALPGARITWANKDGAFAYRNLQREVCSVLGVIPYHFYDLVFQLRSSNSVVGEVERQRVAGFLEDQWQKQKPRSDLFAIAKGLNVILISAESLQAFPIGLEIDGQPVAPRLSALTRESLYFVNFYDQTHLGTTSDGEFASLQSLHPTPVGFVVFRYQNNRYRGLPAILSEEGYMTMSACGAPGDFWNMNKIHPRYGFQQSFFEESYNLVEQIGPWLADRDFFSQSISILKSQREPFLAYLLSSSNHHPYKLPEKYQALRLGKLEGTLLGDYLQSVHYFDQALGEFLDNLRDSGLLDKSIFVLYGDHQGFLSGEAQLAHLLGFPEQSEYHNFLNRKKVPLIIRLPNGKHARRVTTHAGHLDIAPTILSLLGIDGDSMVRLGKDLTREGDSLIVFRDGSFIDGEHCFINRFGPITASSCYDIETGQKVDCRILEGKRREALERLEISDLVLGGDLIPGLSRNGKASFQER